MAQERRRRPGDLVVRHRRRQELAPVYVTAEDRPRPSRRPVSPFMLVYAFGALVAIGTTLLWLPFSNGTGEFTPFLTALFTATSAVCVTGLVVVNTGDYWSTGGQVIIMTLIFIGGLGFMSFATYLFLIFTQRLSPGSQMLLREFLDVNQIRGLFSSSRGDGGSEQETPGTQALGERRFGVLLRLTVEIVLVAVLLQVVGFALLMWRLMPRLGTGEGAWQALFHTVSSFNNAGFDIFPGSVSMALFNNEFWILGITGGLIILGGIGYTVLRDIVLNIIRARRLNRLSLDTRLVLTLSITLWILGSLIFFLSEVGNESTLGPQPIGMKVANAAFQAVSGRTAGLSTVDFGATQQHTNVFMTGLMFIGGAAGSTAGGIKVNTLAVILVTVLAAIQGRPHVEAFRREIPAAQIYRALAVAFLAIAFIMTVSFLMVLTENLPFEQLVFETVSAFGTTGLSTGITGQLSQWGKTIIIVSMFVGRIGPLTLALSLGQKQQQAVYRYSEERVRIG